MLFYRVFFLSYSFFVQRGLNQHPNDILEIFMFRKKSFLYHMTHILCSSSTVFAEVSHNVSVNIHILIFRVILIYRLCRCCCPCFRSRSLCMENTWLTWSSNTRMCILTNRSLWFLTPPLFLFQFINGPMSFILKILGAKLRYTFWSTDCTFIHSQQCREGEGSNDLVGRGLTLRQSSAICVECCSVDFCNQDLCSHDNRKL